MKKGMLVLTLKENQEVKIGEEIIVRVAKIRGKQIRLAFSAPNLRIERQPTTDDKSTTKGRNPC